MSVKFDYAIGVVPDGTGSGVREKAQTAAGKSDVRTVGEIGRVVDGKDGKEEGSDEA